MSSEIAGQFQNQWNECVSPILNDLFGNRDDALGEAFNALNDAAPPGLIDAIVGALDSPDLHPLVAQILTLELQFLCQLPEDPGSSSSGSNASGSSGSGGSRPAKLVIVLRSLLALLPLEPKQRQLLHLLIELIELAQ